MVEDCPTPVSEFTTAPSRPAHLVDLRQGGAVVQLERKGYYRLNVPYRNRDSCMHPPFRWQVSPTS